MFSGLPANTMVDLQTCLIIVEITKCMLFLIKFTFMAADAKELVQQLCLNVIPLSFIIFINASRSKVLKGKLGQQP